MKKIFLITIALIIFSGNDYAQRIGSLINKVKEKTTTKSESSGTNNNQANNSPANKSESSGTNKNQQDNSSAKQADNLSKKNENDHSSNAEYETIYTGDPNCKSNILYNESRLGIGANKNGYTLVMKKVCERKTSFIVIDNGKQTAEYEKLTDIPVPDGIIAKSGEDKVTGTKDPNDNYLKENKGSKSVVVGGKNYGTYAEIKTVFVTPDKKTVFHDWMDMSGRTGISFNGKKTDLTLIDDMEPFYDQELIKSHDKNNLVYLCMSEVAGDGKVTIPAILVNPDGTKKTIKINNMKDFGKRVFSVSSKNEICWLDTDTWDLYTEGRKVGGFKKNNSVYSDNLAIIAGSDLNKAVLYDRMGNLYFLNGHVEQAGAVYPFLITENGKNYISWLKQSGENILKGKIEMK